MRTTRYLRISWGISLCGENSGSLWTSVAPWATAVAAIQLSATDILLCALTREAISKIFGSHDTHSTTKESINRRA